MTRSLYGISLSNSRLALFFFCGFFFFVSALCFTPFLIFCSLRLLSFFYDVVCLACFKYFLDNVFLFLVNSRLIFSHTSVQCAVLQL